MPVRFRQLLHHSRRRHRDHRRIHRMMPMIQPRLHAPIIQYPVVPPLIPQHPRRSAAHQSATRLLSMLIPIARHKEAKRIVTAATKHNAYPQALHCEITVPRRHFLRRHLKRFKFGPSRRAAAECRTRCKISMPPLSLFPGVRSHGVRFSFRADSPRGNKASCFLCNELSKLTDNGNDALRHQIHDSVQKQRAHSIFSCDLEYGHTQPHSSASIYFSSSARVGEGIFASFNIRNRAFALASRNFPLLSHIRFRCSRGPASPALT